MFGFRSADEGVSPVVAVILMVAITVILSAAVGALVLDLGQSTSNSATQSDVAVRSTVDGSTVTVQVISGEADDLRLLVNGTQKDSQPNASPGDTLSATVTADSDVSVVAVSDGDRTLVSTKNPHAGSATTASGPTAPTSDLIAHYTFNAANAEDSTSYNNDGTVNGATHLPSGGPQADGAYSFDGSDDSIEVSSPGGGFSTGFTVAYWVKPTFSTAGDYSYHVSYASGDDSTSVFRMEQDDDAQGELDFGVRQSSNWVEISSMSLVEGEWQHIVGRVESDGTMTLFRNGTAIGTATVDTSQMNDAGNTFWMGARHTPQNFWPGDLDDVRLYNESLTDQEIGDLYNATK